ncbi:MAG: nucleotide exchange factor GrpE [Leptolyngbyaceae cyanobacterium bins.59]|nr:nucleotide exchange factor GrpE [Leptolyngbyaceae cyanobacterium bins.59]
MSDKEKQEENQQRSGLEDSEILEEMAEIDLDAELQEFDGSDGKKQSEGTTGENSPDERSGNRAESGRYGASDYDAEIDGFRREITSLKNQLEERTSQYMRIAADFENFRKRTQKEKEELDQQIKCSTILELLPVVDNFERARLQIKPETERETGIHKSYQSVYKLLVDGLKRIGVSPMRAEGKEFDPSLHEAVMRESTDQYPEDTVIEELMKGYLLGDRVLRHAMVKVAVASEAVITSEEDVQEETSG